MIPAVLHDRRFVIPDAERSQSVLFKFGNGSGRIIGPIQYWDRSRLAIRVIANLKVFDLGGLL